MRRPRAGRGAPQFHRLLWAGGIAALVAAAPALSGASVLTRELAYPGLEVTLDESGLWSVLTLPGAAPEASLGEPTLPAAEVILPLPAGMHVDRVLCEVLEETPLALARPVMPYRGERSTVQPELPEPAPDSAIYGAAGLFPPYSARAVNEVRLSTGACYAVVRIYPVRYAPSAGELLWAQRVRLTVELTEKSASADGLRSKRPMAAFPEAEAGSGPWRQIRLDEPGFLPREVPSVDGAPVEYVIIVPGDDELAAAWQPLADWKTACGHPARVIRTDWIDANYPNGSDPAERVRLFLQDGYVHWGLKWALIGGDVTEVPIRYGYSRMLGSGAGTAIATDYYYACLERTWDADRNGLFGQAAGAGVSPGDSADTTPDIHVGRVSARTAHDVEDYLEKYFRYVRDPNLDGYLDSILLLGEVLFDVEWSLRGRSGQPDCYREQCSADSGCRSNGEGGWICANRDGADDILALRTLLQGELGLPHDIKLLIERAEYYGERMPELLPYMELESANSTMAHMSSGYNIVFQVGHGYHDRWAVGDGRLLTGDLVSLSNGGDGSYFIAYAVNCHSAAVDYDSFGETMVTMADDGAVAYMGCTNADFPDAARPFSQNFFRFLYSEPGATVGDGYYGSLGARALTGTSINTESQDRFLLYTQILLGEPGMPFWQSTPGQMAVTLPDHTNDEVPLGISELRVSVNPSGDAVDRAQVCLHKSGEVYSVGVLGGGAHDIELPFHPRTTGDFSLVVTAPGYLPVEVEGTVVGASASEALHLAAMTVVDNGTGSSRGNGNTQAEPGERLRLQLEVGNAGSQAAADVEARLRLGATAPAGCAQISDSVATLGTIAAGGSASDASAFLITIPSELDAVFGDADRVQLPFTVVLDPGGSAVKAAVTLELSRPRVGLSTNHQSGATGVQDLWVGVANQGKGTASHLLSVLTSENDSDIDVIGTGILRVGDIAPGDTALAGPFSVDIFDALGHLEFALVDTFQSPDDTLHVRTLDLDEPGPPLSPALIGQLEAMQVTWSTPAAPGQDGILGYKVYRAPSTEGPYEDVVPGILTSHRFLNDVGLGSLVFYSYRIAAVDRSGNIGMTSTPVSAYTSPGVPVGWPNFLEVPTKASPLICELDGWTSNGREIIFCAETVYAFHGDGSEVVDGDNADRTRGPFTKAEDPYLGDSFWGKAAAADIDADGDVEVLAVAFNHTNEPGTYPGTHGELFCWGPDGTVEWVYSFLKNSGISWSSPVLADLDSDDRMEVIFVWGATEAAGVYVLDCYGDPYYQNEELLANVKGTNLFQSPAVGDVDGDDKPDIVIATRTTNPNCDPNGHPCGAIWALDDRGVSLSGFNTASNNGLTFSSLGQATHTTGCPSLCNVDGQGGVEIFIVTEKRLWCVKKGGALVWSYRFPTAFAVGSYELLPDPALGDLDRDGDVEVVVVDAAARILVFNAATGAELAPFPLQLDTTRKYSSCVLANLDDDPKPEILFGDDKGWIHAYRYNGTLARGFPIYYGGSFLRQSLAVWDVDLDGHPNIVAQATDLQKVVIFDMFNAEFPQEEQERLAQNPWPMRFRDSCNAKLLGDVPPVAVRLQFETPVIGLQGEVVLSWSTAEEATAFRILRGPAAQGVTGVVGEVPGDPQPGEHRYVFRDHPPAAGQYIYQVNLVRPNGDVEAGPTQVIAVPGAPRIAFGIQRLWPDPLPGGRTLSVTCGIPGDGAGPVDAQLQVYDIVGRRVRTLLSGACPAGLQLIEWDGRDAGGRALSAGLYLLKLRAGERTDARRVLLIR